MKTGFTCAMAAAWVEQAFRVLGVIIGVAVLAGCANQAATRPGPEATAQSLPQAVANLASTMIAHAQLPPPPPSGRYPVTIDPWIDATTGSQIATTRLMQTEIETLAPQHFPQLELLPFTPASLARQPLVLLGAIVPVVAVGSTTPAQGSVGAYRIYGVLADLETGKIAAAESAWVKPRDVDLSPTAFYRDSPVWLQDDSTAAYLHVSASHAGDPIDPAYVQNLEAEALIADATRLYNDRLYHPALASYHEAAALPQGGHQLRIYNGLYLSSTALGEKHQAAEAFGQLVDYGLQKDRLAVKFLFQAGSTAFWPDTAISGDYPMWLREIAQHATASAACLRIVGHASPSGSASLNDQLSLSRAQRIEHDLIAIRHELRQRITATGDGSRDPVVGTGRDDMTDVLDRRVDFQVVTCRSRIAAQ